MLFSAPGTHDKRTSAPHKNHAEADLSRQYATEKGKSLPLMQFLCGTLAQRRQRPKIHADKQRSRQNNPGDVYHQAARTAHKAAIHHRSLLL